MFSADEDKQIWVQRRGELNMQRNTRKPEAEIPFILDTRISDEEISKVQEMIGPDDQ